MKTIAIVLALMSPLQNDDNDASSCRAICNWQCYHIQDEDDWKRCNNKCVARCPKYNPWDYER